jgi:sec-independent protein translocase protein TatA
MPFGIGIMELVLLLAVVLVLFGAKRLPELANGVGLGVRGFQRALREDDAPAEGAAPPPLKPGE